MNDWLARRYTLHGVRLVDVVCMFVLLKSVGIRVKTVMKKAG